MAYFRCTVGGSGKGNTVVVTCASEFAGQTITLAKTGKTYTKTCPSASPYTVTFYGVENGTYTVSATVSGDTYSETVIVQDISAVLNYGFNWQTWVDTAQYLDSTDYSTLSDVLADEEAVRELFTEHACVDYMASMTAADANITAILNNDICAKWINLSDYALDVLYANQAIATVMDTADKYFYGEWVVVDDTTTPPTYGPKGNVPKMTSNTAPYGEVIAISTYSGKQKWWIFNGTIDSSDAWASNTTSVPVWAGYKFVNPTCVRKIKIAFGINGQNTLSTTYKIQWSDDNSTWTDIEGAVYTDSVIMTYVEHTFENDGYHLYYRILITSQTNNGSTTSYKGYINSLQFYGRELSVSVPVLTSNTPQIVSNGQYGDDYPGADYQHPQYRAFDNNNSTRWMSRQGPGDRYIGYNFGRPVLVHKVLVFGAAYGNVENAWTLKGSNDGGSTWETIEPFTGVVNGWVYLDVSPSKSYKQYSIHTNVTNQSGNYYAADTYTLQFYGLDYSEKEFANDGSKWLYDHGVELETIGSDGYYSSNSSYPFEGGTEENSQLYLQSVNSQKVVALGTIDTVNMDSYSLLRARLGNKLVPNSTYYATIAVSTSKDGFNSGAVSRLDIGTSNIDPNSMGVDVSSVQGAKYIYFGKYGPANSNTASLTELWLEP